MIGHLRGIVLEKQPPQVLLEIQGIGYEVYIPMTYFDKLPETGQEAVIFTHLVVRQDVQLLFGFIQKKERMLFRELIKINGVGPKLALSILSEMSAENLINTVMRKKINTLVKLSGVGKKTAERLIIEMQDRFKNMSSDLLASHGIHDECFSLKNKIMATPENEAIAALMTLGFKFQEASRMVIKVARADVNCEILVRDALREIAL